MGQLVEGLAAAPAAPRVVFVVSHLEALKARVARPLFIDLAPGGNRVHQALPGNADAPPPLAPAAPRAAAVAPAAPRAAAAKPAVVRLAPAKKKTSEEKPKRAVGRPRKAPAE